MSHVYWEREEIGIPEFAHVNHSDGRVFVYRLENPNSRIVIGHATSDSTMHPNETFRTLYPDLWITAYSEKYHDPKELLLSVGLFGISLGASTSSGLYDALQKAYGPKYANVVMDYSMYSIVSRLDVTQLFSERMSTEVLFSDRVYSDSALGHFFKSEMTVEMHDSFKILWLKVWIAKGGKRLWLCIDGSNNDCQMEDSRFAESGENKSHTKKNCVGYIYAVDADTGEPVTYFVNGGGEVDCKVFQTIITFLHGYSVAVEGVILDRGFCTYEVVQTLISLKLDYVIMAKETAGFSSALESHGEEIFWDPTYLVDEDKGVFGISEEAQIWGSHSTTGIINLYFSALRGTRDGISLLKKVCAAKKAADLACQRGEKPVIEKALESYLRVTPEEDGHFSVIVRYDKWKKALRTQGFFAMLSSKNFGPQETYRIYQLRSVSETQYRLLKSQEGYDTTRVHTDSGMMTKYSICFISSILRHIIMTVCMKRGVDTNILLQQTPRVCFLRRENGRYVFVRKMSKDYQDVVGEFSMFMTTFEALAEDYNHRIHSCINSQVRKVPEQLKMKKGKGGRPKGSKNKKTLEREAAKAAAEAMGVVLQKPKRGRPFGRKDSKPRKKRSDAGVKRGPRKTNKDM